MSQPNPYKKEKKQPVLDKSANYYKQKFHNCIKEIRKVITIIDSNKGVRVYLNEAMEVNNQIKQIYNEMEANNDEIVKVSIGTEAWDTTYQSEKE